jgi:hypothetical protein
MERATPVEIRNSLVAAKALADAGISFVPMPVMSDADRDELAREMFYRMERLEALADI